MDIHEHGFLLLALMFIQNFARNPVLVNNRLSAASYLSQTLASNLTKSHPFEPIWTISYRLLSKPNRFIRTYLNSCPSRSSMRWYSLGTMSISHTNLLASTSTTINMRDNSG